MNPPDSTQLGRAQGRTSLALAQARGFDALGVSDVELDADAAHLDRWLGAGQTRRDGLHGQAWHAPHAPGRTGAGHGARAVGAHELLAGRMRATPATRWPTRSSATSRATRWAATITRCCATRLQGLADDIVERIGPMGYRVFVDSGPVLEKALARNAGLGWIGKHTNLIARDAGSYFFIGEILTDLPLPVDEAGERALRHLLAPAFPPAPPAPSPRPTSSMRGAAFPI